MFEPRTKTHVEREIDRLFAELKDHDIDSEKYGAILDRISKLHKLRQEEKPQKISPDTLLIAGINLLGIVMILKHEELNVITTRAMSLVPKIR